jgi:anaerobic magnesium-protoporphyrin IX monomethyl ester cyclase
MFGDLRPDFGVIGEGERTIIELLRAIEGKKDFSKVKGIIFEKDGKTIRTENRPPLEDLDSLPYPDFDGIGFEESVNNCDPFINYACNAFDYPRIYPVMGSRSCPFQCTFCYHDTKYRSRSLKGLMKEIRWAVKKYKINMIMIFDDCFAVDKKKLHAFCKEIKKLQKEISWELKWECQLTVNSVDEEILKVMKDAGCDTISYGFESFSQTVLRSMKKPITPEKIDKALYATMNAKIGVQGLFIFGDIAETKETAQETLNYWKTRAMGQIGLGFIQPYPGSVIYDHCVKKGIIKDRLAFIKNDLANATNLYLNMTDSMSDKDFAELKKEVLESTGKYLKFSRPISIQHMGNRRYSIKVKCPFCKEFVEYKNGIIRNPRTYSLFLVCRNCKMRFFAVSRLAEIGYRFYPAARKVRDLQIKMKNYIGRLRSL